MRNRLLSFLKVRTPRMNNNMFWSNRQRTRDQPGAEMALYRYNAFVSYSHAVDGRLAPALRDGLHQFAKPLYRLRALNVFRDKASLAANPALWSAIEAALTGSEYFILLASPEAAGSPWVTKEVEFWCERKPVKNLLLVLTDGEIAWIETSVDFDWRRTTALPSRLHGVFAEEPRWVDLRWARKAVDVSLQNPKFRESIAELAAPLHNVSKDELIGRDIEFLRSARRTRRNFIGGLIMFAIASIVAAILATHQWHDANTQRDEAYRSQSRFLAQLSLERRTAGDVEQAILLAREALPKKVAPLRGKQDYLLEHIPDFLKNLIHDIYAVERPYVVEAEAALYEALELPASPRQVAVLENRQAAPISVTHATFNVDGSQIITACEDATARIWEAATGREVAVLRGHRGALNHASFSPNGTRVATASVDHTARIWDALTARELTVLKGHQDVVFLADFSRDGQRVITASHDGTARLWDATSGAELMVFTRPRQDVRWSDIHSVCCASISSDGSRVVTASLSASDAKVENRADLWEAETGKHLATFADVTTSARSVSASIGMLVGFTPDGKRVVTAATDRTVRFWNAADGSPAGLLEGHGGEVRHATFTSDGRKILTGSDDGTARIWEMLTNREEFSVRAARGTAPMARVHTVAFSPDQSYFVTVTPASVRLWDASTGEPVAEIKDIAAPEYVTVSPKNGHYFAVLSSRKSAIWEVSRGTVTHELAHGRPITKTALSASGHYLLTASADGTAVLWDGSSGAHIAVLGGHTKDITHAKFSFDEQQLLTTSADNTARLWHVRDGALIGALEGHGSAVLHGEFSSDGRYIVTASEDRTARVWDRQSGIQISLLRGHEGAVMWATFSRDGSRILTASDDGTARIWETVTAQEQYVLRGHEGVVSKAYFSPDGTRIVTVGAGKDFIPRLWEGTTGAQIAELQTHEQSRGTITAVAFSPDGSRMLTASFGGMARVWRLEDGAHLASLEECAGIGAAVTSAAFSPDGRRVMAVTQSGRVNIWNIERRVKLVTLHTYRITRSQDPCSFSWPSPYPLLRASSIATSQRSVVTAGKAGIAHLLRILSTSQDVIDGAWERVPRELSPAERRAFLLSEP